MTLPDLPAARLAICIDAGRRNAGELVRLLSTQEGAAECALLLHASSTADESIAQAHHLALAAFPGPNAIHLSLTEPDRIAARNWLTRQAPADWLLFLGPDNLPAGADFLKQYLEAERMAEGPGAMIGGVVPSAGLTGISTGLDQSGAGIDALAAPEARAADPGRFVCSDNLLVHREILATIPFDDGFACRQHEDIDWGLRVQAAYPVRHIDNPVIKCRFDDDTHILDAAAGSGPSLARLVRRHPDLAQRLPLVAAARRVKGIPLLSPAARLIAASPVLPGRLRASAFRLYEAAVCSPYIEPA